jgi:uncharacterized membrane protein
VRTSRLEAFSDGVLAIIITVMVLELKIPEGIRFHDLWHSSGYGLLTYLLSFVYVGIYWNNHHHMFSLVRQVTGGVLWANLVLLFSLSLFPFTTAWVDDTRFAQTPMVTYGINLFAAAVAYYILQSVIIRREGPESALRAAVGSDLKGKISPVLYLAGILGGVVAPAHHIGSWIAMACFVTVAIIWIVPDRRIERVIREHENAQVQADAG